VDETTATLPAGWQERLIPLRNENTGGAIGWCLEVHDLAASKLVAGREKDLEFVRVLLREKMAAGRLSPNASKPSRYRQTAATWCGAASVARKASKTGTARAGRPATARGWKPAATFLD
jgi:hypothetical protein